MKVGAASPGYGESGKRVGWGGKKHRRGIALAAHKDLLGVLDSAIAVFSAENGHPVAGKTNHLQKILTNKVFA